MRLPPPPQTLIYLPMIKFKNDFYLILSTIITIYSIEYLSGMLFLITQLF